MSISRRDASGASIMLRRDAKLPGHLLSQFNNNDNNKASPKDSTDSSSLSDAKSVTDPEHDPSIVAEPLSSTDEENDEDNSDTEKPRKYNDEPKLSLEDKLAAGQVKKAARTSSAADEDWAWQRRPSKRPRTTTYPSKTKSFSGAPTSSARSIPTPVKASPKPKRAAKPKKGKNNKKEETESSGDTEPEDTSKDPISVDTPSPVKTKSKSKAKAKEIPRSPSPQFQIPPLLPNDGPCFSSSLAASSRDPFRSFESHIEISSQSSLSSPPSCPSSPSIVDESQKVPNLLPGLELDSHMRSPSPPRKALCPMCKAEVDPERLKAFEAQPDQRLRQQQRFCASHKRDMATKEWEVQGYPEINWDTLGERLQTYFPDLEKHLTPNEPSYFRNLLESAQKSGQSLRLTLEGEGIEVISCGYYGTKGAQRMLDAVMDRFAVRLRRLAKDDSLVAKVGVVGYSQSVLVPELATRLIMDDMKVPADAARAIMRESVDIGQKINPQLDDVVPFDESDLDETFD